MTLLLHIVRRLACSIAAIKFTEISATPDMSQSQEPQMLHSLVLLKQHEVRAIQSRIRTSRK